MLGEKADEASQIARRCGWKSVQAQALPGEGVGTSGGVMILVRSWVGICYPDYIGHVVVPGRVVAARVDYPGFPPFVAISAYLVSGAGLAAENLEILEAIGRATFSQSLPCIVGGDFNNLPGDIVGTGFPGKMGGRVVSPYDGMGTCKNKSGDLRCIDFFVVEGNLAKGVVGASTVMSVNPHPHRPARIELLAEGAEESYWTFDRAGRLDPQQVFGPFPEPPSYDGLISCLEEILRDQRRPQEEGSALLDKAYAVWARLAELEVKGATDGWQAKGSRSAKPKLVRKSMKDQGPAKTWAAEGPARSLKWIFGRALELRRAAIAAPFAKSRIKVLKATAADNSPSWLAESPVVSQWLGWLNSACICCP